jgi:hypothetical protein
VKKAIGDAGKADKIPTGTEGAFIIAKKNWQRAFEHI